MFGKLFHDYEEPMIAIHAFGPFGPCAVALVLAAQRLQVGAIACRALHDDPFDENVSERIVCGGVLAGHAHGFFSCPGNTNGFFPGNSVILFPLPRSELPSGGCARNGITFPPPGERSPESQRGPWASGPAMREGVRPDRGR
jgi:hypothetical protein